MEKLSDKKGYRQQIDCISDESLLPSPSLWILFMNDYGCNMVAISQFVL